MNYRHIIERGSKILKKNSIITANIDAELLLSISLKVSREKILLNLENELKQYEINKYISLINRRKKKEPISYIVGNKFFWKYSFNINKNVLTPRFETELLVEEILNIFKQSNYLNVLDVGVGSGCILISLLKEKANWKGTAIDISKLALKTAKINAKIQHIENRIKFLNSDIDNFCRDKYDLIISNPPYIKQLEINDLDKDIKNHEPKVALDGGIDGYCKIRLIIKKSSNLIKKKGKLFLEIGTNQTIETLKILNLNGFYKTRIVKDLSSKNRCIVSTKI